MVKEIVSMVKLKKSKIMSWLICPRLYEQQWLAKNPYDQSVEMQFGLQFHHKAKEFFDKVNREKLMRCKTKLGVFALFKPFVPQHNAVLNEWMTTFLAWELSEWLRLRRQMSASSAIKYWVPLATELFVDREDAEYHFDRIDRLPFSNSLINIEYKSGKWFVKSKLRKELVFYNNALNDLKLYDMPCTHIGYFNPQLNISWNEFVTKWQRTRNRTLVKEFVHANELNEFPCKRNSFCRYCSYLTSCPCWN